MYFLHFFFFLVFFISLLPSYFVSLCSFFDVCSFKNEMKHASPRWEAWGLLHLAPSLTLDLQGESMSSLSTHQISYYSWARILYLENYFLKIANSFWRTVAQAIQGQDPSRLHCPFHSRRAGAYLLSAVSLHPKWLIGGPLVCREAPPSELGLASGRLPGRVRNRWQ